MKNINTNIIALGWVSFFTDMASSMVTTLLPIFVVYVLHEGVDKLGVIIAIATFVSYSLRIVFGYLSDKYQIVKPFVVGGYLISAITKPLLMFTHSYASVALLRSVERMGKAVRSASKDSLISTYSEKSKAGKSFGFHKMMDVSGEMSGALIVVAVFYFTARNETFIRDIFGWTLIPGLIGVLIALFFVQDAPKVTKKSVVVAQKEDYKLLWILGSYFLFVFFLMSDQYFILQAKESGMTLFEIPLLVIVSTLTQALLSYYSGTLIDRIGSKVMLFIAYLFGIGSIISLGYGNVWAAFVLLGAFTVISLNAMRAYISKNALSQGFIYGIFYGGVAIFSALGALSIGEIWHQFSFHNAVLFSITGCSFVALVLFVSFWFKSPTA
ncbi:MFS transporter [Sulfurimonas paralvinellae]|uniref:MFS transporter n=1 Tax=Sulfurimonas paralvinellae TaxID=317658 RepID=A0A7M1B6Z7_9BACT|nr:MFS transporter [Sulfurimonas paralvinellae]QOP45484.1 MFS transporter [Sulfurimonas paralvinellae]